MDKKYVIVENQKSQINLLDGWIQTIELYAILKTSKCSTSLIIREMGIKTTMRYHTSRESEWLLSKRLQAINAGEGVEKREPSYTVGGNAN